MDQLDPRDIPVLRMLAGANFLGGQVTLPSGRVLDPSEMQALTSAYAPAVGEREEVADSINTTAPQIAEDAGTMAGRMPRDGEPLAAHYLANGGDPGNERTLAILREPDKGRARRNVQVEQTTVAATPPAARRRRWWRVYSLAYWAMIAVLVAAVAAVLLDSRPWANRFAVSGGVLAVVSIAAGVVAVRRRRSLR